MSRFLVLILLFPLCLNAQEWPVSPETGKITYTEVVDQSGSKDRLYIKAKTWVAETFQSTKDVVQVDDKESGKLILKGLSTFTLSTNISGRDYPSEHYLRYLITLDFKDEKYRYELTNLQFQTAPTQFLTHTEPGSVEEILIGDAYIDAAIERGLADLNSAGSLGRPSKRSIDRMKQESKELFADNRKQYAANAHRIIDDLILSLKRAMAQSADTDW